ncbi:metallophosphoesterase [Bradyrhizobium manausense]|uniref:metallophosphoesterase n=1 Tax=Bradyrhizobium manausense TaxID=989370 RepID=UPI001BAA3CDA|nr:metallophosphoesterase [Bradyrhizobium manausense]MBR0688552.1 metallophosphoesterase [Bradyrhizobium manausense]
MHGTEFKPSPDRPLAARRPVRAWIFSDVHLETASDWELPPPGARPRCDVVVVAGDLTTRVYRGVRWLQERFAEVPVAYIAGNHEFWNGDLDRAMEKANAAAAGSNVHVLSVGDRFRIGDVTIIGDTTWTDFSLFGDKRRAMLVAAAHMNDYRRIRTAGYQQRLRPEHTLLRHQAARRFFEAEMRRPRPGPLVVVSHHVPHPGRYGRRMESAAPPSDETVLAASYHSDMTELMWPQASDGERGPLRPPEVWVHGHDHTFADATIGFCRVVSNARGYGPDGDNSSFDPLFTIEI